MIATDVTHGKDTVELDVVSDGGSWTIRLNARGGVVAILVQDHASAIFQRDELTRREVL